MAGQYQTLSEFISTPFGSHVDTSRVLKYDDSYKTFKKDIRVEAYTHIKDDYFIHLKIPSETQRGKYEYDVVIRFFNPDIAVQTHAHLRDYYIQFFSNSPGFMYKYATLYKLHGYLIEPLYDKMDPDFIDTLPEKTNKDMEMSYDKTIYFALKYLSENQFRYLSKLTIVYPKNKSPDQFFRGISTFKDVKFDQEIINSTTKIEKSIVRDKKSLSNGIFKRKESMEKNKSNIIKAKKTGKSKIISKPKIRSSKKT